MRSKRSSMVMGFSSITEGHSRLKCPSSFQARAWPPNSASHACQCAEPASPKPVWSCEYAWRFCFGEDIVVLSAFICVHRRPICLSSAASQHRLLREDSPPHFLRNAKITREGADFGAGKL